MAINYIQLAIPFFFLSIILEALYSALARKKWYDLHDALANIGCGSVEQVMELVYKTLIFGVYVWIFENWRLHTLPKSAIWVWVLCFILVDLGYYWFHRASHRIHLIWAGHGPHHQSEEYNLSVALRQGVVERSWSWFFWLPLALLGFDPLMYVACVQLNNIYQFFIHTKAIKSLGPLEWLMNTPSHHRVHHGKNPAYIDKNYGGMFIIWDRLFGTFEPEVEEPVYGTVSPLRSWNPFWANAVFYADMAKYMRGLPLSQQLQVLWRPPGWHPDQPQPTIPEVDARTYPKYRTPWPLAENLLLALSFASLLLSTTLFLEYVSKLSLSWLLLSGTALVMGYISIGALIEAKSWFWGFESLHLLLSLLTIWLLPLPLLWQGLGSALLALPLLLALWQRQSSLGQG